MGGWGGSWKKVPIFLFALSERRESNRTCVVCGRIHFSLVPETNPVHTNKDNVIYQRFPATSDPATTASCPLSRNNTPLHSRAHACSCVCVCVCLSKHSTSASRLRSYITWLPPSLPPPPLTTTMTTTATSPRGSAKLMVNIMIKNHCARLFVIGSDRIFFPLLIPVSRVRRRSSLSFPPLPFECF